MNIENNLEGKDLKKLIGDYFTNLEWNRETGHFALLSGNVFPDPNRTLMAIRRKSLRKGYINCRTAMVGPSLATKLAEDLLEFGDLSIVVMSEPLFGSEIKYHRGLFLVERKMKSEQEVEFVRSSLVPFEPYRPFPRNTSFLFEIPKTFPFTNRILELVGSEDR